jgi:hypothetical protein
MRAAQVEVFHKLVEVPATVALVALYVLGFGLLHYFKVGQRFLVSVDPRCCVLTARGPGQILVDIFAGATKNSAALFPSHRGSLRRFHVLS